MIRIFVAIVVLTLAACSDEIPAAPSLGTSNEQPADPAAHLIYILPDAGQCEVQGKKLACSDAFSYVRNELKLDPCSFKVAATGARPYDSFRVLGEGSRTVGCKNWSVNVGVFDSSIKE